MNKDRNMQNDVKKSKVSESTGKSSSLRDKAGDAIEKVGHIISDAGAPGLGQKIHDLGDKLEKDHTDKNHPHDV